MVVGPPPFQMGEQGRRLLCCRPGATSQRRSSMSHCQIHSFNERRVQPPREAQSLQGGLESVFCSKTHDVRDANQLASPLEFFHLAREQTSRHLPLSHDPPAMTSCDPVAKMGREGRAVQVQAIAGEKRNAERRPGSVAASG
jgi:hypothetical protein